MKKSLLVVVSILLSACSSINFSNSGQDSTQERIQDINKVDHG